MDFAGERGGNRTRDLLIKSKLANRDRPRHSILRTRHYPLQFRTFRAILLTWRDRRHAENDDLAGPLRVRELVRKP
jgi:hypothetical protein